MEQKKSDEKRYGIYNTYRKAFQFGIDEPSPRAAEKALFKKIGKDSYKWRFEVRVLPKEKKDVTSKSGN